MKHSDTSFGAADPHAGPQVIAAAQAYGLTRRQTEVLLHVSTGRANKEIASALGCAEGTVEAHMTQLLRKVGVDSRARLISHLLSRF